MARMSLLFLGFLLSVLHPTDAQTIIGSSSSFFSALDLPLHSSPPPTKQTARFWPPLPPRGRSDVPIRATAGDNRQTTTNAAAAAAQPGRRTPRPTARSAPPFISALSTQNLSSGTILSRPTASRPRTDTASLASGGALLKGDATTTKGSAPPPPPTLAAAESAGDKPAAAGNPEEGSLKETAAAADGDSQEFGSGSVPSAMPANEESPVPRSTASDEMAQYQPQAQTAMSRVSDVRTPPPPPPDSRTTKPPHPFALTTAGEISTTAARISTTAGEISTTPQTESRAPPTSPAVTRAPPRTVVSSGKLTENTPSTVGGTSTSTTSSKPTVSDKQPLDATTQRATTAASTAGTLPTTREAVRASSRTTRGPNKTAQMGRNTASTTAQSSRTGTSSVPRLSPTYQAGIAQRNRSVLLGHPHQAPPSTSNPASSPGDPPSPNGTLLYWGDLSRTLAFAWELHVYGSASLFLLLFAGAALGLALSPGANCPHRGALALANALLFLAGGLRAALFLIDPYGTRKLLPRPAVTALYNLPLHLLVWTQAALALLALRVAGVSALPSPLERPPLVAVLAVLQCTLLLAADLLSPALSPVVPVTLQVLSLCWGLALCLGFLCYVFPRIRCSSVPHRPGVPEEAGRKAWTGSRRTGVILSRVLAVCAVLGSLCCGLHVHATLWLYGLLGDWTRFNWGWWLVHFWARLLELAWGFSLLLLASWVFWRPRGCRGREEGGPDGRAAGDLPSPGQSTGSPQRHTCWSKIVQSLTGKPCRKSESNGVVGGGGGGGGGGGPGEVPNNWAGQERPGADISKSLIRNQNRELAGAQPRCVKDSNRGRNHRGHSAERGVSDGSTGSLLRLQALGRPPQRSASGSLDPDRDTSLSLYEFDLRPPSPIDLGRSIDEALNREHLFGGGSLFRPLNLTAQSPSSLGSGVSPGPWLRRNSDPQLLSESSDAATESSMPLGGSIRSSVPSRQVTAPPTPSHQGHRWAGNESGSVPSSVSCPVSLRPSRTSTGNLGEDGVDDTRPFITPDSERVRGRAGRPAGSRSYLEVSRQDDSASVSSEIIDL